jgi:hypothetical protein
MIEHAEESEADNWGHSIVWAMERRSMQTPYDWITVAIFAGIVVLFLQRSVGDSDVEDSLISYFPPAIACAVANQFGNNGYDAIAIAMIAGALVYCWYVLKPFAGRS